MLIKWETRPEDCQQKNDFKMETLNFHTIFAHNPKLGQDNVT